MSPAFLCLLIPVHLLHIYFATCSQWGGCHKKYADEDVVSSLHYWPAGPIFSSLLLWIITGSGAYLLKGVICYIVYIKHYTHVYVCAHTCVLVVHDTQLFWVCSWKLCSAAALVVKNSTIPSSVCSSVFITQLAQDRVILRLLPAAFWKRNGERFIMWTFSLT